MIWRTTIFIITLFLSSKVIGQDLTKSIDQATQVISDLSYGEIEYTRDYVRTNYGKSPFNPLFRAYKNLISTQDNNSCSFHPSCSNYAIESVKKKGIFKGGISAFDRLSRCHGMAPEYYEINEETKKLDDPVRIN